MIRHPRHSPLPVALGHLVIEVCNNYLPVVYPLLVDAGRLTYTQVGTITLVSGMCASLTQPFFGHLSDRWSPRHIIALSIACSGLSMGLVGFAEGWLPLALLVALAMIGSAAFHPSGASRASAGGGSGQGRAVATFSVGGNLGAALSPLVVTAAIRRLGIRGTIVVVPIGLLGSVLLYYLLVGVSYRKISQRGNPQTGTAGGGSLTGLILVVMAVLFRTWFHMPFLTYLPTWARDQGRPLEIGAQMLFAFTVCAGMGSLIGGALADRIGRWQTMGIGMGLLAPIELLLLSVPPGFQLVLVGVLGVLVGITFPAAIVAAQDAWPGGLGMASGLALGLPWVGGGLGGLITGFLADHVSVPVALRWLALPAVLATLCVLAYLVLFRRQRVGGPEAIECAFHTKD